MADRDILMAVARQKATAKKDIGCLMTECENPQRREACEFEVPE